MTHQTGWAAEDVEAQVRRITRSLQSRGTDASDDVVERTVRECFAERQDAKIREFVSLLAERTARERLRVLTADRTTSVSSASPT